MSEVIERLKMPIEERWRNTCMGLWTTWVNLSRYYAEEFGWKKAVFITLFEVVFAILVGGIAFRLLMLVY